MLWFLTFPQKLSVALEAAPLSRLRHSSLMAKVTYRLHFSVLRNGQAILGARGTKDVALRKTPRGWRIAGGDGPQLENVIDSWSAQLPSALIAAPSALRQTACPQTRQIPLTLVVQHA